ncbi:MAG: hypothetical protein ACRDK0_13190 [Solirubrobacteraceae bacterium]
MVVRVCIVVGVALAAAGCSDGATLAPPAAATADRPSGVKATCATRSGARFPGAFSRRANLVVGPLAMIGAAGLTTRDVVHEFGGNKFPLLVRAGHTVTVELLPGMRRTAALGYGPLPQGEIRVRDGHRVVTFVACPPTQDSGSDADGEPVTFWSGFMLAGSPQCVSMRVWVDDEPAPRKAAVPLGRRCR